MASFAVNMATTSSVMEAVEKTDVAKVMVSLGKRARLALVDFHGVIENLSEGSVFLLKCGPERLGKWTGEDMRLSIESVAKKEDMI